MLKHELGFTSYWFYGDLQWLLSQYENGCYFFINNYLDVFSVNADIFELYFNCNAMYSPIESYLNCPFLKIKVIDRRNFQWNIESIKSLLDDRQKILVYLDRKKFDFYNHNARRHQVMIYDYDEKSQTFMCCDNGPSGKFSNSIKCSYDEILSSYKSIEDDPVITTEWEEFFVCLESHECPHYNLELSKILNSLKSYAGLSPYKLGKEDEMFDVYGGVDSYLGLSDRIKQNYGIWLKGLHKGAYALVCDHKRLLKYTCEVLVKEYSLPTCFVETSSVLLSNTIILEKMVLKYIFSPNDLWRKRILSELEETREKELQFIIDLINYLEYNIKLADCFQTKT